MNVDQIVEECNVELKQAKMLKEIWDLYQLEDNSLYEFLGHLLEDELDINRMEYDEISSRFCVWGLND